MGEENLTRMRVGEVAHRARQAGVRYVNQMSKEQMIQAIRDGKQESSRPGRGGAPGGTSAPQGSGPSSRQKMPDNES